MRTVPHGREVMWLDPGLTTGWATLRGGAHHDFFISGQLEFVQTGVFVRDKLASGEVLLLGWERFDITPHTYRMKGSSWALEVTGMLRWLCYEHNVTILPSGAREARKIAPKELLKKIGWYMPGAVHANDAAQHMLAWCIRSGNISASINDIIRSSLEGPDSDAIR